MKLKTKENLMIDLTYKINGLFATFYVNSNDGLSPYKTIAETMGSGTINLSQLESTLYQLKQAGYKTRRVPNKKTGPESFTDSDAALLDKLLA
jgi:hypothetical protein